MSAPVVLQTEDGVLLHTEKAGLHTHLITEDHSRVATHFKAGAMTVASTVTVVTPRPGGAIVVTDILYEIFKLLPMSDADQERLVSLFCDEYNEFSATGQPDAANTINELIYSITKEK